MDKKLIDAWKKGDINARNKAWVECLDRLFTYALKLCGNQEDTATDIFHSSIQELDSELKKGKFTWKPPKEKSEIDRLWEKIKEKIQKLAS